MRVYDYRDVIKRIEHETETIDTTAMHNRLKGLIEEAALVAMPEQDLVLKTSTIDLAQVEQVGYVAMPCDMARVLRITHNGNLVNWRRNSVNIFPPHNIKSGNLTFHYYSIDFIEDPVEGQIMTIGKDSIDYCAYSAIATILQDRMIMNPALQTLYQIIIGKKTYAYTIAKSTNRSKTITDYEQEIAYSTHANFQKRR